MSNGVIQLIIVIRKQFCNIYITSYTINTRGTVLVVFLTFKISDHTSLELLLIIDSAIALMKGPSAYIRCDTV